MGLIQRIWNGELPLVKVYWLYGVVFGAFVAIFSVLIKDYPTALILLTFALIPYQILVFVGIWRSADAYTNKKLWAVLAKVHVVLGIISALNGVATVIKNVDFNTSLNSPQKNEEVKFSREPKWILHRFETIKDKQSKIYYDSNSVTEISSNKYQLTTALVFDAPLTIKFIDEEVPNVSYLKRFLEVDCNKNTITNVRKPEIYSSNLLDKYQSQIKFENIPQVNNGFSHAKDWCEVFDSTSSNYELQSNEILQKDTVDLIDEAIKRGIIAPNGLLSTPAYLKANHLTKRYIFEKNVATDESYISANEATKEAIRKRFGIAE